VALSPLDRLFGRRAEPAPSLVAALADLDRLTAKRPELAPAARALVACLRAAFGTPSLETIAPPNAEVVQNAWREGVPAFRVAPPALDRPAIEARAVAICDALRAENPAAGLLRKRIRQGEANLLAAWESARLGGAPEESAARASAGSLDSALLLSVLRLALLPALARFAEALAPSLLETSWTRGDCPNCGQVSTLAESRGLEQRRFLRCGLCAAEWPGDRLRCSFCGETDPQALHYRFVQGERDRHRLALCDRCGGGLKVVSTLAPMTPPGLLVAELETVHLDMID
jgi:FdhE protein